MVLPTFYYQLCITAMREPGSKGRLITQYTCIRYHDRMRRVTGGRDAGPSGRQRRRRRGEHGTNRYR